MSRVEAAAPAGADDGETALPVNAAGVPATSCVVQPARNSAAGASQAATAQLLTGASADTAADGAPSTAQSAGASGRAATASSATVPGGGDAHEASGTPLAETAVCADVGAEVRALVAALLNGDVAAKATAARRVAELAAGERDAPRDEAACAALLAGNAVAALCTPVKAHASGDAAAREAECAALRALMSLTDCHPPARDAVASEASGWLPALCALMQAEPSDAVLVDLALHVTRYTTRGGAAEYGSRRRGGEEANIALAADTCKLLCAAGVPAAVCACICRITTAAAQDDESETAPADHSHQQGQQARAAEEGSQERILEAAAWCLNNVCLSSLPPSCAQNRSAAQSNSNATAVYDAGAVATLTQFLGRRPLVIDGDFCPWLCPATFSLGCCVAKHADRDVAATRDAIESLVALLDPQLYCDMSAAASRASDAEESDGLCSALRALLAICARNEACCNMVADTGGIRAALELYKPEHLVEKVQRQRIYYAADLLNCVLPQSAPCRRAFLAAGGFAAPALILAAAAHVAHATRENAVRAACYFFFDSALLAPPELHEALCSSGVIRALCSLMEEHPSNACQALWTVAEDKPGAAAVVRDCGGVAIVARLLREIALDPEETHRGVCAMATGLLMTLSNNDSLAGAIADEKLLEPLSFVVRESGLEDARLCALLAVSCVYSGRAEKAADALLAEHDITRHLKRMLDAVLHKGERLYLGCSWSEREVANYVRLSAVDAASASRLAKHGVVPLLLELLLRTKDAAVQRQVCRALFTLSFVPEARDALLVADAAAKVARFSSADDALTSDAAKGVLARLADGGADGDTAGAAAAAAAQTSFRVFLSHKRTDAKDFARALHTFFMVKGVSAFLDFEFKEDLHDLGAVISRCDNLVFILTENIFDSYWCRVELCAAVRCGVNIVLVRKEGVVWSCSATGHTGLTHPPASLINALELDEDVAAATRHLLLSHKSVEHSDVYYGAFTEDLMQKLAPPAKAAAARAKTARTPTDAAAAPAVQAAPSFHAPLAHASSAPPPPPTKKPPAAAAAASHQPDDVLALRQEVLSLRHELAALRSAPALMHNSGADGGIPRLFALLGSTVAVVAVTGCVAMVAIVAAVKQHARQ